MESILPDEHLAKIARQCTINIFFRVGQLYMQQQTERVSSKLYNMGSLPLLFCFCQ